MHIGKRNKPGQALVEFTMILPLLLMMVIGMADFAIAYTTHVKLRNAVAEGGYYAAQNPGNESGIQAQIVQELTELNPPVQTSDITIASCVNTGHGFETHITVAYQHNMIFGAFGSGPSVTLRNSTIVPQFGGCR
ncbi:MAG: pilus assembly protein [Oscillochloris sp.]|nr:pilus assembly protein [Oscillochloris sp.]